MSVQSLPPQPSSQPASGPHASGNQVMHLHQSEFDPHSKEVVARAPLDPHLKALENEAIHIFREVAGEFDNPVMLYSIGKDSSVLLHLARKAFYPGRVPFPLLHIDTGWKFKEMIAFRDEMAKRYDLDLVVHTNPRGKTEGVTPFSHGSALYTDIMKTEALRQALDAGKYDAAFGGARRDEEASRAKERIYSFRTPDHKWDPRNQRPELWNVYNGMIRRGESVRAFPLSTGRKSISGAIFRRKTFRWCRCISPKSGPSLSAMA